MLVVTEGILTAYLQQDPLLTDVATIVIDEFTNAACTPISVSRSRSRPGWRAPICHPRHVGDTRSKPCRHFSAVVRSSTFPGSLHPAGNRVRTRRVDRRPL
jgi:hypothetical protein